MATFWNLLKALIYLGALLLLVGGGLCAVSTAFIPAQGMGAVAIYAVLVMLVAFAIMKWVGRPRFTAGSPGEATLYIGLFLVVGMPMIQVLANALGLGAVAPYLALSALVGVIYFFVRRHKALSPQAQPSRAVPPTEPPPQA